MKPCSTPACNRSAGRLLLDASMILVKLAIIDCTSLAPALVKYIRAHGRAEKASLEALARKVLPLATLSEEGHLAWQAACTQEAEAIGMRLTDRAPGTSKTFRRLPLASARKICFQAATSQDDEPERQAPPLRAEREEYVWHAKVSVTATISGPNVRVYTKVTASTQDIVLVPRVELYPTRMQPPGTLTGKS